MLGARALKTAVAGNVELYAMPDDVSGDVVSDGPEQPFHCRRAELADGPAPDADRVVVVLDAGKAVHGSAIH